MDFTTGNIPRQIKLLAIPASVGFFFHTMFSVVDTFFAGGISTEAVAAMSISFPVFFSIIALAAGLGAGTAALISNKIGAGQARKAARLGAQSLSLAIIFSIFLTFTGIAIAPRLFELLGARGELLNFSLEYTNLIFVGTIFFAVENVFNSILSSHGDTRTFRNFLIAGFFANLILDPLFLFGGFGIPEMGLAGIALATVVIQFFGVIYVGIRVAQKGFLSGISVRDFVPDFRIFGKIIRQAAPASLRLLAIAINFFVITFFLQFFGAEAVAAFGISIRIEQIAILPALGLSTAALTLVGQNNGARKFDRAEKVFRLAVKYGFVAVAPVVAAAFIFAPQLVGIFSDDPAVINFGTTILRIGALTDLAYVANDIILATVQALRKPNFVFWNALFRELILPIGIFWILIHRLGLGINAIWWAIFALNWIVVVVTFLFLRKLFRRKLENRN